MPRVVLIGGGFAGLTAARHLGGARDVDVTLVDRRNHHLFQPLLYQVAMAGLSPADISAPIRSLLARYRNISVRQDHVERVDLDRKTVVTTNGELGYDYLLLACGAVDSYFGHDDWAASAPSLKSLGKALEIRRRVLSAFERAEVETDAARRRALLTFVIVGGGPTGVELAGALGEMSRFTLACDFRHIDPTHSRVLLIEGGPRVLPSFPEASARRAMRDLESLGVQVWTSSRVTGIDASGVQVGDERVDAKTVLWAAGVHASPLAKTLGTELDHHGRVVVDRFLNPAEHREVFVAGDVARAPRDDGGEPLPGLAPVAMQQGRYVARSILGDLRGREREPFHYFDKGQMATIGRSRAVVDMGWLRFGGFPAWVTWIAVHIYFLVGFRNRLFVMLSWAWAYLTFRRGARLIVENEDDVSA